MASGAEVAWRAQQWRAENNQAWQYMADLADNEAAHERHFSVRWLMEEARKLDFVDRNGDLFRINNNYNPVFARMLIQDHPELSDYIETRRSKVDGLV